MTDSLMAASREPIDDAEVDRILGAVVTRFHEGLAGAKIAKLWMLDKPESSWGRVKIANEVEWWLSSGVDLVLVINKTLWLALTDAGRMGLLDHFLSMVAQKTGGQTQMKTVRGTRQLYESSSPSLSVHPHVMARNPSFVTEVKELARLHRAITDPQQYLLDFNSGKLEEEPEEEEEEREPATAAAG